MSKEFEEIVLKKLGNIETEIKDLAKDTNQKLEGLETEVKDLSETTNERLGNLEIEVKDTKQGLLDLAKDTNQKLEGLETEVKDLSKTTNQRLGKLEIEVMDTGEVVLDIRQRFAKFDFEINRKIDTLFDSDTVNKDNIVSLNVKTFDHDTRISNLENKDLHLIKL